MRSIPGLPRTFLLALAVLAGPSCGDDSAGNGGGVDGGSIDAIPDIDAPGTTGDQPHLDPDAGGWVCPTGTDPNKRCECDDGIDNDGNNDIDGLDPECAAGPWVDSEASGPSGTCGATQCTNCIDDDNDGVADSADPECTGPLDNDEYSFATGIPGDNKDLCHQDCWFDGDSGSGNDGCRWDLGCDPVAGPAYGCNNGGNCDRSQPQACVDFCKPLTPNGCDCFGCCSVFVDGVEHTVLLSPLCSVEDIRANNGECVSCTKVESCNNECDPCEWCLGRPPIMTCNPDGGTGGGCEPGIQACTPDSDPDTQECPTGYWCLTGCCVPIIQ